MKEQIRKDRIRNWLYSVTFDCRYSLRQFRKNLGFTAVAILTLALCIGVNIAIFSVVNAVLLRPLPFEDSSQLVSLSEGNSKSSDDKMGFSAPDLVVFTREQKSFSAVGSFRNEHVNISGRGEPERIMAARISASLFPMLGVNPMLGRAFTPEEDAPGNKVVILSYGLWQRWYGGALEIGQTIDLNRQPYTVIGVMRQNFEFPLTGTTLNGEPADLWIPMAFTPEELEDWGGTYNNSVVGRLRPGVTLEQAGNEARSITRQIIASYPAAIMNASQGLLGLTVNASSFQEDVSSSVRALLVVVMASVAFVLSIACANMAILLVSRGIARQKEIGIRLALGATRLRVIRQMLTESLLLGLGGGCLGIVLALWIRNFILAIVPSSITLPSHVPFDGSVFAFTLGVSILTTLIFGLAPAFQVSGESRQGLLQGGGRSSSPSRSQQRLQGFFVTFQFALTLILLVGAGLLVRSFGKLLETSLGFRPDDVLTVNVPLPREAYPQGAQVQNFYKQLLDQASNLPGVQAASLSSDLPLNARVRVAMRVESLGYEQEVTVQGICLSWVMGNYHQAMGIPLLQGRWFTTEDRLETERVTVVSRSAAEKFWPGQNAIGKRIRWGVNDRWHIIVGVVGDVRQGPLNAPLAPHVYRAYTQLPGPFLAADPFGNWRSMNLAARTQVAPASLTSGISAAVHSLDPHLVVANVQTMREAIRTSIAGPAFNMILVGGVAGLALLLSAIGVYGVLAHMVSRQTHEIGIRMALGANPRKILGLILGRGAKLVGIGAGFGLVAGLGLTRLMKSLIYGVGVIDPLTFVSVGVLLIIVGLLASYIPARRALRVDPMVVLRHE
jgi:putative ABC transport system permease protein